MTDEVQSEPFEAPALVVFGLDDAGKAHASSFIESEVALAEKAAGLMGMRVLPVTTDAGRALAAKVPKGKVFASGKAFTPFVKSALFAELQAAAPPSAPVGPKAAAGQAIDAPADPSPPALAPTGSAGLPSGNEPAPVPQPSNWADIQVGAIVLAAAAPRHTEYFECMVLGVAGEEITLRYLDWPREPPFTRQRVDIGLMHPSREPDLPAEAEPSEAA